MSALSDEQQYEFRVVLPDVTLQLKGEAMACMAGCLIIYAGAPILCLAPGAWCSAERLWLTEVEEEK